jgi:Ca2+-binding EF-hand superfamily protein
MISETPFLCLASVYAQELLDYLKQFDKDGKGSLSKEELQEVMRGRMRCGRNDLENYDR